MQIPRPSLPTALQPVVSDSFYCVKLFATRAIKPVANKHIIARGRSERPLSPRRDSRLHPFGSRQPVSWRAFFRRLALIFRSLTLPALPVHDYNGDLVGD